MIPVSVGSFLFRRRLQGFPGSCHGDGGRDGAGSEAAGAGVPLAPLPLPHLATSGAAPHHCHPALLSQQGGRSLVWLYVYMYMYM